MKYDITAFQDGDDFVLVFHRCSPETQELIKGILNPVIAPDADAKPVPSAEKEIPRQEKEPPEAPKPEEYFQMVAETAVVEPETGPEEQTEIAQQAAVLFHDPAVAGQETLTLPDGFGKFTGEAVTQENLLRCLHEDKKAFNAFMDGRRSCQDSLIRAEVAKAVVTFVRNEFNGVDPNSKEAAKKIMTYAAAVPGRFVSGTGLGSVREVFEKAGNKEKKKFVSDVLAYIMGA